MAGVSIDVKEVTALKARIGQMPAKLRPRAWQVVRATSFAIERRIKPQIPIDIGRARSSWGHSTPPALPGDGVWEEDEAHLALTQGSRVEYFQYLNEGHSKQAPAGFVDAVQVWGEAELERQLDQMINGLLGEV